MSAGSDVETGLTEAQKRAAKKANLFGIGYENGKKLTIGCSYKGRIWSRQTTHLLGLQKWCLDVGQKITDKSIDPDDVLRGTLVAVEISNRPLKMPIYIDWPDIIYSESGSIYQFMYDNGHSFQFHEMEIRLVLPSQNERILFEIGSDDLYVQFELKIFEHGEKKDYRYATIGNTHIYVKRRNQVIDAVDFFYENNPKIWFADGSSLEGNSLTELNRMYPPYPKEKIQVLDWSGINIRKESQGITHEADSIQYRVVSELQKTNAKIIFDDDGSGEVADIVTIQENGNNLAISFYHCKFSIENQPGGRIDDLYAVCGQAQKSIHWIENPEGLFNHLQLREPKKRNSKSVSRFIRGNGNLLQQLEMKLHIFPASFSIYIVQPGLSKEQVSQEQLELLSATENYLMETYKIPFGVIASS